MKNQVVVVAPDNIIIVDGEGLKFDFERPENLWAIQWHNGAGHIEYNDSDHTNKAIESYEQDVQPYVALWEDEKARLEAEQAKAEAEYNSFENVKARAITAIDSATSAAILAGFDYEADPGTGTPEKLHFSYDSFDQINFNSAANIATMSLSGVEGLPTSVVWNAYRDYTPETGGELVRIEFSAGEFLSLYSAGAMVHKATCMEVGGQRKAQIEAAETAEAVQALLDEWGI